ncbi:hypothetical protein AAFF_G00079000 [Aldrovandia affinis]|uniref:Uncharacterized protein n=1 Tax=Aldrovandia affinis TaxID=143900 RepID=A0AAD7RX99_9TELE|nr:hypothetical protein AAFF_G00079000 [Aldrovandia affinis]
MMITWPTAAGTLPGPPDSSSLHSDLVKGKPEQTHSCESRSTDFPTYEKPKWHFNVDHRIEGLGRQSKLTVTVTVPPPQSQLKAVNSGAEHLCPRVDSGDQPSGLSRGDAEDKSQHVQTEGAQLGPGTQATTENVSVLWLCLISAAWKINTLLEIRRAERRLRVTRKGE